jgi:hypothetical protein
MNNSIKPQSKSINILSDIIFAQPGIRSVEIAAKAGYCLSHVKNALAMLSGLDIALPVPMGGAARGWFPAEQAKPLLQAWENARIRKAADLADRKINPPVTDRGNIVLMAAEPGGATYARMIGELKISHQSLGNHCPKLVRRGKIFKSERKGCRARWFDTQARADEWAALPAMVPSEWSAPGYKAWQDHPARKRRLVAIGERIKSRAPQPGKAPPKPGKAGKAQITQQKPAKPAGVHIPDKGISFRERKADFSKAKVTKIETPSFTCAWQARQEAPDERWPQAAKYIPGIDPMTGRAWA